MDLTELVARIRAGNAEALAMLLEAERESLLGFLRGITGDHLLKVVSFEDLYQEVATSALSSLASVANPEFNPSAWLRQLCRRRVADAHRFYYGAEKRAASRSQAISGENSTPGLEGLLIASITSPSEAVSRDIRLSRVKAALDSLGESASKAIHMRYIENNRTKEIAEILGKSDVAVRVLIRRSLRKLAEIVEKRPSSS